MAKILVVEDEKAERDDIADILELEGYQTIRVENGEIGLECIQAEKLDLIITGFWMPHMNGDVMIAQLRKISEIQPLPPIIFMVQHVHKDVGEAMVKMGVKSYLIKPYAVDELLAQVAAALNPRD